jgi:hypothetical protein
MGLAVSAAVTATAMEAAAAMEAATAAREVRSAREAASATADVSATGACEGVSTAHVAASSAYVPTITNEAVADVSAVIAVSGVIADYRVSVITAVAPAPSAAVPTPSAITPAIPGSYADEEAIREPAGPVVSVRRAGVRSIVVITIGAVRRVAVGCCRILRGRISLDWVGGISWDTDSHSYRNLRVRRRRRHQNDAEYSQQRKIFEKPHLVTSWAQYCKAESGVPSGSHR